MIQYLLVHAYKAGKLNDIKSFFADCGDRLMGGPDAVQLSAWFVLPYISSPSSHPTFQVLPLLSWMTSNQSALVHLVQGWQEVPRWCATSAHIKTTPGNVGG